MKKNKNIDPKRFNWDLVLHNTGLSYNEVLDVVEYILQQQIGVARTFDSEKIQDPNQLWYKELEIESINEIPKYCRWWVCSEDEKKIVREESKRYMRANIFQHSSQKTKK